MRDTTRTALAGARLQVRLLRRDIGDLMDLAVTPLFAVIFLAIVQHAQRPDLLAHAILAPVLIALWSKALYVSGEIIEKDRIAGTLEPTVAAPGHVHAALLGRIAATSSLGVVALASTWLVAWALFGILVPIHHPVLFAIAFAATLLATAGTSVIMSAVFVLARSARTFQNSLSYPFYVLGGILVPVALLPSWVQPLSRLVYLSWAADLLRDTLGPDPVTDYWLRLGAVLALGAAGFAVGRYLLGRILNRVRSLGTITYA